MQQTVAGRIVFKVCGPCRGSWAAWEAFVTGHSALTWPSLQGTPECRTL